MHQTTRHNLLFASQTLRNRVAFMGGEQISEHAPNHLGQPAFASQTLIERVAFMGAVSTQDNCPVMVSNHCTTIKL
jgi:hypothetical protein